MKKNFAAAALVLLAVCVGLGMPLGVSVVRDRALLNNSESIDGADAELDLNTRGSVSLAQKFWLISSRRINVTELQTGRYMTSEQVGEKALEYIDMLKACDIRCVDAMPDGEYHIAYQTPELIISENNSRAPSLIAWAVCVKDLNGSMNFLIDDESGALLSLVFLDSDGAGWENGETTDTDLGRMSAAVERIAQLYGAEVIEIYESTNDDAASNFNEFCIEVMFPGGLDTTAFAENGEGEKSASNVLTLRVNSMVYAFNDGAVL